MSSPARKVAGRVRRGLLSRAQRLRLSLIQAGSLLLRHRLFKARKVIIFLVPGHEFISGGILSIFNLCRFTRALSWLHRAEVLICFYPGQASHACRYTNFENDEIISPFEMALKWCVSAREILVHVPEHDLKELVEITGWDQLARLRKSHGLRLNILNQNNLMMPDREFVRDLAAKLPETTCTAAHPIYATAEWRNHWGVPLHFLPAWLHRDDAPASDFQSKRNLMIVSPDANPHRETVLAGLARAFPEMEIRVICKMRFEDYLVLERQARWALTFGEGMDGYFVGVALRGGVSFAVFNADFFTAEFRELPTVYPDYETLERRIADDIRCLYDPGKFNACSTKAHDLCRKYWGPDRTRAALEQFYRGHYTHP